MSCSVWRKLHKNNLKHLNLGTTPFKQFEVPTSYVDKLRRSSVLEAEKSMFPNAPLRVDTHFKDQFELRPEHFQELMENVVPGTAKTRF